MKKLLYTLLAVSLIFSACEEDAVPEITNNNTNSANTSSQPIIDYEFTVNLNGVTHKIKGKIPDSYPFGNSITGNSDSCGNVCKALISNSIGTHVSLEIDDTLAINYINGGMLEIQIRFFSSLNPLDNINLGNNYVEIWLANNSGPSTLGGITYLDSLMSSIGVPTSAGVYGVSSTAGDFTPVELNISDLGTASNMITYPNLPLNVCDPIGSLYTFGETVKGNFSGNVFVGPALGNAYDNSLFLEIDFQSIRYIQ